MSLEADDQLLSVAQARNGDPDAWDTLLRRYRLPIYIYIFQLVRNEQTSFDLVQETMVSAIRNIGMLQDDRKFASWLYRIAHQKCLQLWRRQNREGHALRELGEEPDDYEENPRQMLIREEQRARFLELLEQLPFEQRSALVLFFVEEFSLDEIASITGTSVGTVKSRLHYAKKALRALWEKENV